MPLKDNAVASSNRVALGIWSERLVLPTCLVLTSVLALAFLNSYQNWGDDWAQYMLQAKAILHHSLHACVQQNDFMMRESAMPPGPVSYPWGLPLLLALEGLLFPFDLHVFKVFNVFIFCLLVLATHFLARQFMNRTEATAAALIFGFNPVLLHYCNHVLTEIPFTLISVCAFITMGDPQRRLAKRSLSHFATGVLAFAAFVFRSNGILILVAATVRPFLVGPLVPRDRRCAISGLLFTYTPFIVLYVIWNMILPGGGEGYLNMLRGASVSTLITNALTYPVSVFDFFTGGHLSSAAAILLSPLIALGALQSWRRTAHLSVYGLLTLAAFILWPPAQGYRFMIPLTPFLVILLTLGLNAFAQWPKSGKFVIPLVRSLQFGLPILFLAIATALVITGKLPKEKWHPYDQSSTEMFQWIRSNTSRDAVISFFKPRAMHLLGERLCLTAQQTDIRKASYLVYTKQLTWNEEQPSLQEYKQAAGLIPVFANRNFIVYLIEPNPATGSNRAHPN